MIASCLTLLAANDLGGFERLLAVLGGAAVGGLSLGLLGQLGTRYLSKKPMPRPFVNTIRLLGAAVSGWLVWLLVFGLGGGGGGGDGGGWWPFGQQGSGGSTEKANTNRGPGDSTARQTDDMERRMTVEVVGKGEVQHRLGTKGISDVRFFRLPGERKENLLSPDDLKTAIRERHRQNTKLDTVEFVLLSENSPGETSPIMATLKEWVRDNGMKAIIR